MQDDRLAAALRVEGEKGRLVLGARLQVRHREAWDGGREVALYLLAVTLSNLGNVGPDKKINMLLGRG